MKYLKYLSVILLSSVVFSSCSSDEDQVGGGMGEPVAAEFRSTLGTNPMSRAVNSEWTEDDRIGIFMKKENQELTSATILSNANNIEHVTTTGNGSFLTVNSAEVIYFPENGDVVDFVSYYPFRSDIANFVCKIDITDQGDQEEIDFMYSVTTGQSKVNPQINLDFKHLLSKLAFNFKVGEGVTSLQGLKVTIKGLETLADFDLAKGTIAINSSSVANFDAKMQNAGNNAEAIVLPVGTKSFEATFTLGTISFTHTFENQSLIAGKKNVYEVEIKNSGNGTVTPQPEYAMWSETPLFEEKDGLQYVTADFITITRAAVSMRNYSMLYDETNRVALWVAYPLHDAYYGNSGRTDTWGYDPNIADNFQPFLKKSWSAYPTYNRGHQIASSDRTVNKPANRTTFYYSNMTLQQTEFNGGTWNELENKARVWGNTDTLFVVTGVIISTPEKPIPDYLPDNSSPKRMCALPQFFYKVLAKKSGSTYQTIGYKIPNVKPKSGDKYDNYRVNVESLEKDTGFKFFPNLDANKNEIGSIFN